MTSSILSFFEARDRTQPAEAARSWTNQELAEFYRVADSLNQSGLAVDTDFGLSDEGEPWFAFYHPETAEVVAHFARIDGRFVAAGAALNEVVDGRDLREIIDRMLRARPLMIPVGNGRGASNLLLHPAIVLTAFVATALFTMQDAEAAPLSDMTHADRPAKAAPTLIQKLLAGAGGTTGFSKHNTTDALSQGLQQTALQAAIAFAVSQLPADTQPVQAGDLLDTVAAHAAHVTPVEAINIAIQNLADFVATGQKLLFANVAATIDAAATSANHGNSEFANATIALTAVTGTAQAAVIDQTLVGHNDAATATAIKATASLVDLLREVAQVLPQHTPQTTTSTTAAPAKADSTPVAATKTFEVTLTVDATHTAFLQSQLFKDLLHLQSVEVTDGSNVNPGGTITVKLTFDDKAPPTTPAPTHSATPTTAEPVAAPITTAAVDTPQPAVAPADTIVKTGIEIYDQIIDFTINTQASGTDSLAQALRDLDAANGHLIEGAKRIVLFDSADLSLDVYRISADVVMVDRTALQLGRDQAAAGHNTMEMHLPNGVSVELLGVLAPSAGLF